MSSHNAGLENSSKKSVDIVEKSSKLASLVEEKSIRVEKAELLTSQ